LLSLLEVVLGPLWVWIAYTETPSPTTLVGGAVITAAVVVQATTRASPRGLDRTAVPAADSS
jgi:drug/metabolite transporter (DMT)-like permease